MKTKMFLGVLLSLALVLGLLPALLPGMNLTAKADAQPTYKIQVKDNAYANDTRTLAANVTLPYQTTGYTLRQMQGYNPPTIRIELKSGNNITITGTDISITGPGTSNIWVFETETGYANFDIIVTKNITASATGYDGSYDGNDHGISVDVSIPASGATVKYGTQNGTYDLTESPKYKDAGNYTVYYQVTADDYNTKTGSAQVKISKVTPSITALPTASAITYGQTLANSTLTGGTASVPGTFAWETSSTSPTVNDSNSTAYPVVFTPKDTTNYNSVETAVKLTVNSADPEIPTELTAFDGQTLVEIPLPEGWAWDDLSTDVGEPGTKYFPASYTHFDENYHDFRTELEVVVNAVPAKGVMVVPSTLNVFVSETKALTATFIPDNATNKTVSWSSSDEDVATVDQDGKVTGVFAGEATITATSEDGGFTAECAVTVKDVTFEATIGNGQSFGSEDLFFKFELETPIDGFNYMEHFREASVFDKDNNETKLVDKLNCDIARGSLDITLYKDFLNELKAKNPGTYTLVVTFDIRTATATFIVPPPTSADTPPASADTPPASADTPPASADTSPASGESMVLVISAIALMLFAACGGVYAVSRRKAIGE